MLLCDVFYGRYVVAIRYPNTQHMFYPYPYTPQRHHNHHHYHPHHALFKRVALRLFSLLCALCGLPSSRPPHAAVHNHGGHFHENNGRCEDDPSSWCSLFTGERAPTPTQYRYVPGASYQRVHTYCCRYRRTPNNDKKQANNKQRANEKSWLIITGNRKFDRRYLEIRVDSAHSRVGNSSLS